MRAGLLSQPQVIRRLNADFVSTSIADRELVKLAKTGDRFAREVFSHWESPVNLMFLTPDGRFISKLSTLKDLTDVHPDTTVRPMQRADSESALNNMRVFFKHLDEHVGDNATAANP